MAAPPPPPAVTRGGETARLSLPPKISLFTAEPGFIQQGEKVTLRWNVTDADRVKIEPNVGSIPPQGQREVAPNADTEYELIASGPGGVTTAQVRVRILPPFGSATSSSTAPPPAADRIVVLDTAPPVPASAPASALDKALDALPDAGFVLEIPQLEAGRKSNGRLVIDPRAIFTRSPAEAKKAMAEGAMAGRKTKVAEVMEAELVGSDGLRVIPQGPARREVSFRQPTTWFWELQADTPGVHSLRVLLRGLVRIRGEEKMVDMPPFPQAVRVDTLPARAKPAHPAAAPATPTAAPAPAIQTPAPGPPLSPADTPSSWMGLLLAGAAAVLLLSGLGWWRWSRQRPIAPAIAAPVAVAGNTRASVLIIHAPSDHDRARALCVKYAPGHEYLSGAPDRSGFLGLLARADAVAVVLDGGGTLDAAVDWQIEKALQAHRERHLPMAALLLNPEASIQRLRGLPDVFRPDNSTGFSTTLQSIRPVPARRILCFFSYSRTNRKLVEQLAKDLEAAGLPCWLDLEDIPGGTEWERRIAEAIEVSSHVLFVLTAKAMESQHVQDELAWARDKKKVVIPLLLEAGVEIPFGIHRMNGVDFTGDYASACQRLIRGIRGSLAATA